MVNYRWNAATLGATFAALSAPTRRAMVERLARCWRQLRTRTSLRKNGSMLIPAGGVISKHLRVLEPGHKAAIVVDTDSQLITAVDVLRRSRLGAGTWPRAKRAPDWMVPMHAAVLRTRQTFDAREGSSGNVTRA